MFKKNILIVAFLFSALLMTSPLLFAATKTQKNSEANAKQLSAKDCEAKKQAIIATAIPDNASVINAQETVMYLTKTTIEMIDRGCPIEQGITSAQLSAERQALLEQYEIAQRNCETLVSGNKRCDAKNHYGPHIAINHSIERSKAEKSTANPQASLSKSERISECEDYKSDALDKMIKVTLPGGSPYTLKPKEFLDTRLGAQMYEGSCFYAKSNNKYTVHQSVCMALQTYLDRKDEPRIDEDVHGMGQTGREALLYNIEHVKASAALGKAEICYACGRAGVEEVMGRSATCQLTVKKQNHAPVENWETSPGIGH